MSGVNILYSILSIDAGVLALVPIARIKGGTLPEGIAIPAIAISKVSGVDRNIPNAAGTVFVTDRVQVSVLATTYTEQQNVIKAVRKACRDKSGAFGGFVGVSVVTDLEGPDDIFGQGTGIYTQSQDFKVTYTETP